MGYASSTRAGETAPSTRVEKISALDANDHRYSGGTDLANQVVFDTPVEHWDDVSQLETTDKGLEKTLRNPLQGR